MGQLSSQDSDTIPPELFNAGAAYYTQFCTKWEHMRNPVANVYVTAYIEHYHNLFWRLTASHLSSLGNVTGLKKKNAFS